MLERCSQHFGKFSGVASAECYLYRNSMGRSSLAKSVANQGLQISFFGS